MEIFYNLHGIMFLNVYQELIISYKKLKVL
jgi:hypothetical protein